MDTRSRCMLTLQPLYLSGRSTGPVRFNQPSFCGFEVT
jgi:hypothetical protein